MIFACLNRQSLEIHEITPDNAALLKEAIWIDLLSPTLEEELQVEQCIGFEIPTREEMVEIELSSRLYQENDAIYMTANIIAKSDSPEPHMDAVTFVLSHQKLITIRYIEPQPFKLIISSLRRLDALHRDAFAILIELLDATVDRQADMLELVGRRLDKYSKTIFCPQVAGANALDYRKLIETIGADGDLNTKVRESLVTFNRLITFFNQTSGAKLDNDCQIKLVTITKDISALSDHANFLSTKINFLLDATLGMVNIDQNNIIKIFSVAAVIFLPPTLVASIYGMNFHAMPELSWKYGYPFAIGMILIAAWLPYRYFKYRKWL